MCKLIASNGTRANEIEMKNNFNLEEKNSCDAIKVTSTRHQSFHVKNKIRCQLLSSSFSPTNITFIAFDSLKRALGYYSIEFGVGQVKVGAELVARIRAAAQVEIETQSDNLPNGWRAIDLSARANVSRPWTAS